MIEIGFTVRLSNTIIRFHAAFSTKLDPRIRDAVGDSCPPPYRPAGGPPVMSDFQLAQGNPGKDQEEPCLLRRGLAPVMGRRRAYLGGRLSLRSEVCKESPEHGLEVVGAYRLVEIRVGPLIESASFGRHVTMEGADNDPQPRETVADCGDRCETFLDRHLDLEDDEIGIVAVEQREGRALTVCLADHRRHQPGALEHLAHEPAPLRSGIDQHNTKSPNVLGSSRAHVAILDAVGAGIETVSESSGPEEQSPTRRSLRRLSRSTLAGVA
jgi:hypothetical protein